MNGGEVRRFSKIEIAYHWIQAVPYLALVGTGGLALFQRVFDVEFVSLDFLSIVHRIVGIILILVLIQIGVLIVFAEPFRVLVRTIRESFSWKGRDFLWLAKASLNTLWKSIHLPAVGRFNPGQKIHLVAIAIVLPGFSLTGLYMILVPGALAPWVVHLALFLLACPLLALHLFLALLNPETRRALGAVFHGHVSRDYAAEHHPLWIGDTGETGAHQSLVSWKFVAVTGLLVSVAALCLAGLYGFGHLKIRVADLVDHNGSAAIMPRELSSAHGNDPEAEKCLSCHGFFFSPASTECLQCHDEVGQSIAAKTGLHGAVEGECRSCHSEHQGETADIRNLDRSLFNHNIARFPLEGAHNDVDCEKCHLRTLPGKSAQHIKYMGLAFQHCTDCHQNVHSDSRAKECLRCHTMDGWDRKHLVFDHDRDSSFPLDGKHGETDCVRCHRSSPDASLAAGIQLFGLGTSCADCHDDPHHAQFKQECNTCHSERGWNDPWVADSHGRGSEFPLVGKHASLDCTKCHRLPESATQLASAQFSGLPKNCAGCHEDPHKGGFGIDCQRCHSESGWKVQLAVEGHGPGTRFPLMGKHFDLSCEKCHTVSTKDNKTVVDRSTLLPVTCEGCHKDPHRGQFSGTCTQCHSENGWKGRWLVDPHGRNAGFPLVGKHAEVSCSRCHSLPRKGAPLAEARFLGVPKNCEGCHTDPHEGQMSFACSICHSEGGWTGNNLRFSHNQHSSFALDNIHKGLDCSICHGSGKFLKYRPLPKTCEGCHSDIDRQLRGVSRTVSGMRDPHFGRVRCDQCHDPRNHPPSSSDYAMACRSCHSDLYVGLYYDWMKAFDEFDTALEKRLAQHSQRSQKTDALLRQRRKEAKRISLHNVQLAQSLWEEVLKSVQ